MSALRLSLRYGHGDLAWADKQSRADLADILALERIDTEAAEKEQARPARPPPRGRR